MALPFIQHYLYVKTINVGNAFLDLQNKSDLQAIAIHIRDSDT